ncbi:MAG: 8-amino-7-oxononanoate synthase [Proteobacteria bacterium]|nr:8-amino-7-oxononanoate synthase [Pseudomonadota bacterium]
MTRWTDIEPFLASRCKQGLQRQRIIVDSPQTPELQVEGERLLSFCSNDYLGLAADPRLAEAANRAIQQYGFGAGASHLVTGHMAPHHELETALAEFTGSERALLFSTGYMANLAVVATLLGRHDRVIEDKLNHASLIDAARLSGARVQRYAHGDMARLQQLLEQDQESATTLVATDSVFSMDGDIAAVAEMLPWCRQANAWLLLDEAHAFGVLGEHGGGSLEALNLTVDPNVIRVGTLGKAFGSFGAFVAGSNELIELLIQTARTYIYTTALPPAVAAASQAALEIIKTEPQRREMLQARVQQFRTGVESLGPEFSKALMPSTTPIQPLLIGDAADAVAASEALRQQGILVTAIRPPTVPAGTARLRITLSAGHTEAQVDHLLDVLATLKLPGQQD